MDNDTTTIVHCEDCINSDDLECSDGYVWCDRVCRYMKKDGFCSLGERSENNNE